MSGKEKAGSDLDPREEAAPDPAVRFPKALDGNSTRRGTGIYLAGRPQSNSPEDLEAFAHEAAVAVARALHTLAMEVPE